MVVRYSNTDGRLKSIFIADELSLASTFQGIYTCVFSCCQDGLQGIQGRHQMDRFSEIRSENSRMPGDHYSQESHPQSMLNSGCQQSYGLDHYQQGLKRDAMTRQDNWDLKRQRY
ncbi:hypothetical protein E2C01_080129 [Portunus trituberculatus]|uniref:Uncharacterized protein n=1 Tax=Portunus trituberculatus TaxID=210409 RepID=A0A5B7IT81_PORTR|nr:hypothetical protein [Portunus trituberculatus]